MRRLEVDDEDRDIALADDTYGGRVTEHVANGPPAMRAMDDRVGVEAARGPSLGAIAARASFLVCKGRSWVGLLTHAPMGYARFQRLPAQASERAIPTYER